jgi:hypothetical protein
MDICYCVPKGMQNHPWYAGCSNKVLGCRLLMTSSTIEIYPSSDISLNLAHEFFVIYITCHLTYRIIILFPGQLYWTCYKVLYVPVC